MKRFLLLFITCAAFYSCTNSSKIEREGEPEIYTVEDEGQEMNEAIKAAVL